MGVFGAFLTRHLSFKDMASRTTREHWYIFSEKKLIRKSGWDSNSVNLFDWFQNLARKLKPMSTCKLKPTSVDATKQWIQVLRWHFNGNLCSLLNEVDSLNKFCRKLNVTYTNVVFNFSLSLLLPFVQK